MILDELVVHDFGPYVDRQKIILTPPSPDRPIILIGGLNGHGKTTLFDAFQLCLYGQFANVSNRNGLSYQDYLSRCFHRGSKAREASVETAFRHTVDGHEDRYRVHRSWCINKSICKEYFEVIKNGRRDDVLAENWITQVEEFIPPNIASLFLFDGEQVESYAAPVNSTVLIATAIRNLLGLDIVDQLDKDILTYSRRKRAEDHDDHMRVDISQAEEELEALRQKRSALKQNRAALMANDLDQNRKHLHEVECEYRRLGGDLYEHRVTIERDKVGAERAFEECANRLREIADDDIPLIMVRDLMEEACTCDQEEDISRRERYISDILKARDEGLLMKMQVYGVDEHAIETFAAHLAGDRKERLKLGQQEPVLNLLPDARNDLHFILREGLDALSQKVHEELERFKSAEDRVGHTQLKHSNIPSNSVISEIARRRDKLIGKIAIAEAQLTEIDEKLARVESEIESKKVTLTRMIESDLRATEEREDRARTLHHAKRVRDTLGTFRHTVIEKHVSRISQLVLESYQQLLHKSRLVTGLEIDPDTFALTLYGHDGQILSAERLSAGERQLLAIALLWGLAKASGRALPVAIDTPLGRLDAGHRKLLVERYFPYASHQVMLLSTDEEILGVYLDKIKPFVGRYYNLCYDDTSGGTKIVEGYFEEWKAA